MAITEGARARLFAWDHARRRCTVAGCRASVLWPNDDPSDPMCEQCWDAMADRSQYPSRLSPTDFMALSRALGRVRRMPRNGGRVRELEALSTLYGLTVRTLQRYMARGEPAWVEAFGRRALFVDAGDTIVRVSDWVAAS